jgi:hypothetical protein
LSIAVLAFGSLLAPLVSASDENKTTDTRNDAWDLLPCSANGTFQAHGIPGGFDATIHALGFTLYEHSSTADGLDQKFIVLGSGRDGAISCPWAGGVAVPDGRAVWYQGEHMAVSYVHSPQGLRQNFTVFNPPEGEGQLSVTLELSGDHIAAIEGEDGLRFTDPAGHTAFDYRDLHCWDATQKPLKARMRLVDTPEGQRLAILVDDRDAIYPVTIDPVSTSAATLLVGPLAGQEFGYSVCTAGDLNGDGRSDVAVGAWQTTVNGWSLAGSVYVYYGTNTGISTVASIILNGTQTGAQFGNAVSTAGDVNGDGYNDLLVGSRTWESNASTELSEGAVFVFYGSATGINAAPDLTLQTDHADDNFGSNVACAGDINNDGYSDVLVGAYLSSYPTFNEGAVFVYMGSAVGLNPVPQHRLERNQGGAFFGRSCSSAGDINGDGFSDVIVGSSKWLYTSGASDQGSAFIYYGSALGLGVGLNPPFSLQLFGTGSNNAYYGFWVACAGDLNGDGYSDVSVSGYSEENGQTDEGLVYVYHGSGAGLIVAPVAVLESNQAGSWMGRCMNTAGDVNGDGYADLLVGVTRYSNGQSLEGAGWLYFGSPTGIPTTPSLTFELNNAGANLGETVCTAGDVNGDGYSDFIMGARIYGLGGAAAIYLGGPYSTNLTPTTSRFGGASGALLGSSVGNAGDVNGDGYADAIVGAPGASNGQAGEGIAYVHYGGAAGLSMPPSVTLEANTAGAAYGSSVGSAGDVNGDGYADVVVGAPLNGTGRAYLYLGSPGGLATTPANTLTGGSQFGASVATAGDVDHDGYADVIIGSPGSGEAYVFRGSAAGLITAPHIVLSEPPASGLFGCSVSTAGDVDGDGYSDVIVGARLASNGEASEGLAYVYLGSPTGIIVPYQRRLEVNLANADFGVSVSGAGDVNGDGFFDVVVGADLWESGQTDEGAAFIFHGSSVGTVAAISTTLQRNITDGRMGHSVAEAGDVNGDGYADIIVGAPLAENPAGTADEGIAWVFRGSPTGIGVATFDQLEPNMAGYQHGTSVSGAGDVDGDGYSDVLVGAPNANPALLDEGADYWYRGALNRGLNRLSRQYDADLVTPLSTNSQDFASLFFFGIGHRARSPIQRCRARLRWEVVREGQPYSNSPITNSVTQTAIGAAWTTLPLLGVEIKQLIPKTAGWLRHKWRVRAEYDMAKLIDGQRFSRWFYGYASGIGDIGILPIELLSFEGRANDEVNDLTWATATEHMSERFDLLRSSDASGFAPIASIAAAGESQSTLNYAFTDVFPPSGTAYYQLRMVDIDGYEELSDVVAISRASGLMGVFPNPADDAVQVIIGGGQIGGTLYLIDTEGRTLMSESIQDDRSMRTLAMHGLAAGSYAVVLRDSMGAVVSALPLIKR